MKIWLYGYQNYPLRLCHHEKETLEEGLQNSYLPREAYPAQVREIRIRYQRIEKGLLTETAQWLLTDNLSELTIC